MCVGGFVCGCGSACGVVNCREIQTNMQGAHLENTFTATEGKNETTEGNISAHKKAEQERICTEVLNAEIIGAERVE